MARQQLRLFLLALLALALVLGSGSPQAFAEEQTSVQETVEEAVESGEASETNSKTADVNADAEFHQYLIVGAGPGGLQLAAHLEAKQRDYRVLDKASVPGSFFHRFPRHSQLISINKRFTGRENPDFNLRHDWNSLLPGQDEDTSSPLMRDFSTKFFPDRREFVDYLQAYVAHHKLKLELGVEVVKISKDPAFQGTGKDGTPLFHVYDQTGKHWTCEVLIVATAQTKPFVPVQTPGMEDLVIGYEDLEDPTEDPELFRKKYENKRILVLGLGNSAFETAAAFSPIAAYVNVLGRSEGGLRQAYNTHYVGDLRVVNDHILDTFLLKSLDTVDLGFDVRNGRFERNETDGLIYLRFAGDKTNFNYRDGYDYVVRCLGWRFDSSIFDPETMSIEISASGKFPVQNIDYESISVPNLFFAGNLMHFMDFKESAGGFIHGFRYLVRNLARRLGQRFHGEPLFRAPEPEVQATPQGIARAMLNRIQTASGPYQMFGVLGDLVLWDQQFGDGTRADYVEEVILAGVTMQRSHASTLAWTWHFDYGKFLDGRADNSVATLYPGQAHRSQFLHPVIRFYLPEDEQGYFQEKAEFHIMEDFLASWNEDSIHYTPLVDFIARCLEGDFRSQEEILEARKQEIFESLTEEQLASDVTIAVEDPFYGEFEFPGTAKESRDPQRFLRNPGLAAEQASKATEQSSAETAAPAREEL